MPTLLKLKIKCSQNTSKKLSQFTNFSSKYVSVCSQKKHLHNIISWRSRTTYFQVLCQYISVYLSKKMFVSKTYKILSGGIGGWGRLNNFFKAACCLALVKWLTIFHFNCDFSKFHYFSVFRYFHQ